MSERTPAPDDNIELVSMWDGEVEHAPGLLYDVPTKKGTLGPEEALSELAGWVAATALSGLVGNAAYEGIKTHVRKVLKAWLQGKADVKLDELQQQVTREMEKQRLNGRLTEEQLKGRIDAFFNEIRG